MARKIVVTIAGDSSSLVNAFRRSSRSAKAWNSDLAHATRGSLVAAVGFRGLGRSIAFASASFVGGAGLTAALKSSIEGFTAFQEQMQKTVGLANVTQGAVAGFSKQIEELAPIIGKGPQELAQAFYQVASSGIAAKDSMAVVRQAAQASVAGLGDTATVANALTSVINAYGKANIDASQAADVLTATVREGKGEAADFAPVIGNVVALASQLGVSFDQVGAALAVQTRLGTDAETTAIQLQRVFSTLLKVTPKSAAAFASVGLNADDLRKTLASPNGLIKVLTMVKAAFGSNTPALANAFGDVRALRGILNLVGKQTKSTQEVFDRLANSAGSANKAFKAVDQTAAQQFRKLKASAQVLGISLGAIFTPLAVKAAQGLTKLTQRFQKFVDKIGRAKGFQAKLNVVTTGLDGLGQRLGRELLREFNKIDWVQVGKKAGEGVKDILDALIRIGQNTDWAKVGRIAVRDIAQFFFNVDWTGIAKKFIHLAVIALVVQAKLFAGAGWELMKQLDHGIRVGAKLALLTLEKFALQMVKKITGATSFLGRFDPFKGLKEKADRKLDEIQRRIDELHGKDIDINIRVNTSGRTRQGAHKDVGSSFSADQANQAKATARNEANLAQIAAAARARAAAAAAAAAKKAQAQKDKAIKAFQNLLDAFSLEEDKAAATKSLKDDIAVQKKIQAAILAEMKIEGKTVALQQQLFDSRQKVIEFQKQIAENQAAQRKKNQFLGLGLDATGDKPTPGAGSLLHRTKSLREQIKGTVLDTPKTISELTRITKVLQGKFGKVGKDVRAAILQMLNDISSALDDKKGKGPLTKTHALNTEQIAQGLGLDDVQARELRSRLSKFNTAGRAISAPKTSPGGFRGGEQPITLEAKSDVVIDGVKVGKVITKVQQKRDRRNPQQKRGPNRR